MTAGFEGLPMWAWLVGLLLTGGSIVALFQYLSARTAAKSGSGVAASTVRVNEVAALGAALDSLAGENKRLIVRLDEVYTEVSALRVEMALIPTREDLLTTVEKLRTQLLGLGETPINGPKPV